MCQPYINHISTIYQPYINIYQPFINHRTIYWPLIPRPLIYGSPCGLASNYPSWLPRPKIKRRRSEVLRDVTLCLRCAPSGCYPSQKLCWPKHTHRQIDLYIYICMCVCMYIYIYIYICILYPRRQSIK